MSRYIKIQRRAKAPVAHPMGGTVTTDRPEVVEEWLADGYNYGFTGEYALFLDEDELEVTERLFESLSPLPRHVRTGSGKFHSLFAPELDFPVSKIWYETEEGAFHAAGDVKRKSTEYVVAPGSVHPNGERYEWLDEPEFLEPLPPDWRVYLLDLNVRRRLGSGSVLDATGTAVFELPTRILRGERHDRTFAFLRSLKLRGVDFKDARRAVLELHHPPAVPVFVEATEPIVPEPLSRDELEREIPRWWAQANTGVAR